MATPGHIAHWGLACLLGLSGLLGLVVVVASSRISLAQDEQDDLYDPYNQEEEDVQETYEQAADPTAAVRCYLLANDRTSSQSALELCAAATSEMPARCFAEIDARTQLSDSSGVELCRSATSFAPAECFERLEATSELDDYTLINYCRAPGCEFSPPPGGSAPECLEAADRENIEQQLAGQMCQSSFSDGPVTCFVAGDDQTQLSEYSLAQLCSPVPYCYSY